MERKTNCPICEIEIDSTYYTEEVGLVEEHYNCDNCGYAYEFAYGNYKEFINGKEYDYYYNTPPSELEEMEIEFNMMRIKHNQERSLNDSN